jgi:hypothetical protein
MHALLHARPPAAAGTVAAAPARPAGAPAAGVGRIVDDDVATLTAGQMRKRKRTEYRERQQRLVTLRAQEYQLGGGANDPTTPATAPTTCPS